MAELPVDVTTLAKVHGKLAGAASSAPNSTLRAVFRLAASAVNRESAAITNVVSAEKAVVANPTHSASVMALATQIIATTSASAVANAYLLVDHSLVVKACKSAG
jgi:hypothetical protein